MHPSVKKITAVTAAVMCVSFSSLSAYQSPAEGEALPLEPTRNISFTTDEVTWMSLDVSPDGKTVVFDILGDLYTVPVTGGKATRITSGMALDTQPRYSPDGKKILFVSDRSGSENLWILDTGKKITDTTQESESTGLKALTRGRDASFSSPAWSPDGKYVAVSKTDRFTWIDVNHTLWMYNVDGGRGEQILIDGEPVYGLGPVFGPQGRYLYTADRRPGGSAFGHQIDRIDLDRGTMTRITKQVGGAVRPALSSDGKWMVYGSRHDAETGYRLRDMTAETETWLAFPVQPDMQEANWMATSSDHMPGYDFTPDNSALITSMGGKLYRIDIPSGQRTEIPFEADVEVELGPRLHFDKRVADGPVHARLIRWPTVSPDGTKLAFTALHKLYVKNLPDGAIKRIAPMNDGQFTPAWSPDSKWIAFVTWSDTDGGGVYTVSASGSGVKKLSRLSAYYNEPVWTPDGEEIVVSRGPWQERGPELNWVRIPAGGGEAQIIAPVRGSHPHFADSPDRLYVYEGVDGLVSMRLDGTDRRVHLKVTGRRRALGPGGPQPADVVLMGPDGNYALAQADYNIYRIAVPHVGDEPPVISVEDPRNATFPVEKLNILGTHYVSWGSRGREAVWSLGNTVFRSDFSNISTGYTPEEVAIDLDFPRQKGNGTIVFRGARLLTMEQGSPDGGVIGNGAVIVTGDRISAVGPSASINTPPGAREIDVAGKTILPGFVDLHGHLRLTRGIHRQTVWSYLENLAFGVTTTRDPQTGTPDVLTYSDMVAAGEIVGPRIFATGPGIFNDTDVQSLDDARNVLKRYAEYYRHNTVKQYLAGDRTQRQLIAIASKEYTITPTTEGVDMKVMLTQIVDGYSLEHILPHFPLGKDVVTLVARSGTFYTPTLVVGAGPRSIQYYWTRTEVHDDPRVRRFMPHDILDTLTRRRPWYHTGEFRFPRYAAEVKKILDAGGNVGLGSHGEMQGIGYHWEIWNVFSGGVSAMDALRCATIIGADALGFARDLGSLKAGKLADLIVLNSNPLDDIRNTTDIRYVMKNGLLYDADTLDMLWPVEKKLPKLYWEDDDPKE